MEGHTVVDLIDLKEKISKDLEKQSIPSKVLLNGFRVLEEASRKTSAYQDPKYVPFYYYLGRYFEPRTFLEIGFRLGMLSGTFLKGCKTVENFLTFQEKSEEFYSPRLSISNIKDVYDNKFDFYFGKIDDDEFSKKLKATKWDLVIINEEFDYDKHREYLDHIWPNVNMGGIVLMDYISFHKAAKTAFFDFCKIVNRQPTLIETRYGVGLIQK